MSKKRVNFYLCYNFLYFLLHHATSSCLPFHFPHVFHPLSSLRYMPFLHATVAVPYCAPYVLLIIYLWYPGHYHTSN